MTNTASSIIDHRLPSYDGNNTNHQPSSTLNQQIIIHHAPPLIMQAKDWS
jgi:hypothetical protein